MWARSYGPPVGEEEFTITRTRLSSGKIPVRTEKLMYSFCVWVVSKVHLVRSVRKNLNGAWAVRILMNILIKVNFRYQSNAISPDCVFPSLWVFKSPVDFVLLCVSFGICMAIFLYFHFLIVLYFSIDYDGLLLVTGQLPWLTIRFWTVSNQQFYICH